MAFAGLTSGSQGRGRERPRVVYCQAHELAVLPSNYPDGIIIKADYQGSIKVWRDYLILDFNY